MFYFFHAMQEKNNISVQMKKGILEYMILLIIDKGEVYAPEIISTLKEHDLLIVEGTLYPLLSRLKKDQLLGYSWVESSSGPPRKYYRLTPEGKQVLMQMGQTRNQLNRAILGIQSR